MTVQMAMTQFASRDWSTRSPAPSPRIGASRGHLAVLDDDAFFCEFLTETAELCGYDVFATTDCDEFFLHVEQHEAAVVVLDLHMPRMGGLQVLRRLADEGIQANVLLASGADERALDTAICLGRAQGLNMAGIIRKPIGMDALQALLESQVSAENPLDPSRLERAIKTGELVLHYQPIVDLRTGLTQSVEALVRWRHPRLGLVMPSSFVGVAEQGGLIDSLTDWALAEAARQAAAWRKAGSPLQICVNISNASIPDETLPERLAALCAEAGIPASDIAIELTESVATQNPARAMEVFVRLRSKGFDLSIDDFGTGYSSLAQLQRLPFTSLKIDRSFVSSVLESEASASIVLAIISLAHALGLKCIAEGVESVETMTFLKENGCDFAQGYHHARPMPAGDIPPFLSAQA